MEDLNDKVTGNTWSAAESNQPMSELQNVITSNGQSLTNADLNQLGKAIANYVASGDEYTDSGSANAIVLNVLTGLQGPSTYFNRQKVGFRKAATNTGPVTINVNGLGVLDVKDQTGADLASGDLVSGVDYVMSYDPLIDGGAPGFKYEKPSSVANVLPRNYIDGLITSNNSTDSTNDIDIAAGTCKDSTNTVDMTLSSALGKQIDVAWAEGGTPGATAGGFPTGITLTNDTWYRVFVIRRATGQIDAGFDNSSTAANLLADATNYSEYRQVAWIYYTSSAIVQYIQTNDRFMFEDNLAGWSAVANSTTASLQTLTTPAEKLVLGMDCLGIHDQTAVRYVRVSDPDQADIAPTSENSQIVIETDVASTTASHINSFEAVQNASSQLRIRATIAGGTTSGTIRYFIYPRGKE